MAPAHQENVESTRGTSGMMKKFNLIRFIVFAVATIALAKFFEAGRLISSEMTFEHLSLSICSLFSFFFSLLILGYWIYVDEKEKNNLKHKFGLYEWIYKKSRPWRASPKAGGQ